MPDTTHIYCRRSLGNVFQHETNVPFSSSNIYSADMFDAFFKIDPMNVEEGRRYRREVLEKGGSQPEMEILISFLGREPSPLAFYKELGLIS